MATWTGPITWVNGEVSHATFNAEIRDRMNWLKRATSNNGIISDVGKAKLTPALVGARVYRNANQTIGNSVSHAIDFDKARFDSDGFLDDDYVIRVPAGMDGYYLLGGSCCWAGNASGARRLRIAVNGTFIGSQATTPSSTEFLLQSVKTLYLLAVGDVLTLEVLHTAGVDLDIAASTPMDGAEFWLHRLSTT